MKGKLFVVLKRIAAFFAIVLFFGICGCSSNSTSPQNPVIFVHGYAGSADQFETQAMRFATNGYPKGYVSGYEYDTSLVSGNPAVGFVVPPEILLALDAYIDSVLKQTGADKVDLLGHSMGTAVCHAYLADPTRAAKVAHYVNIDGMTSTTPPGGVPTLALFAELSGFKDIITTGSQIGGATNITLADTSHVQAVSCSQSFVEIYKFFNNGRRPFTTDIRPGYSDHIELAGRIITFMTNAVPDNLKLDIYEVNKDTGVRMRSAPDYSLFINTDGNFIFPNATAGSSYEFYLTSTLDATAAHYYYEPFVRSDGLIRLKFIPPAAVNALMDQSDHHSNLVIIRNKEFLGVDALFPNEDSLKIRGDELCAGLFKKVGLLETPIALFVFDKGADGINDLSGPVTSGLIASLPFISGLDFFINAANPPDSTISIVLKGRYAEKEQVVNVPNWPSTTDKIMVQMWDY